MSRWSAGRGSLPCGREAEVVLAAAEVAEPGQVVDEQEELGAVAGVWLLAQCDLAGHRGKERGRVAPAADLDLVRQGSRPPGSARPLGDGPRACRRGRRTGPRDACRHRAAGANWAARLTDGRGRDAECRLVVLADDQEVVAALAAEQSRGRVLDRDRVAQPGLGGARRSGQAGGVELLAEQGVARQVGRGVALEDDRRPRQRPACARWPCARICFRYVSRRSSESQTTWKKWLPSGAPLASL